MIDVHVPSIRPSNLVNLAKSMKDHGLFDAGAQLTVVYSPKAYTDQQVSAIADQFPGTRMTPETTNNPIAPSMVSHRIDAHRAFKLDMPWMLFDDDDEFVAGSFDYIRQCVNLITSLERIIKRPWFIGTAGHFGSNSKGDHPHFSPANALMPKGHGIIFSQNLNLAPFEGAEEIAGGLEEHLICAWLTEAYDAIPIKRFRNPSKIKFRREADRQLSAIHNWEIWNANSMAAIRGLSGDHSWVYPRGMGSEGSKTPRPYRKRVEALSKTMAPLVNEVWSELNAS